MSLSFLPSESILVLGDGDFSFSVGLVRHCGHGGNVVATSLDSEADVVGKYPTARKHLAILRQSGARLVHGVDGRKLAAHFPSGGSFDRIVFNFPHSGHQRVHVNRDLLRDCFRSCRPLLAAGGTVNVTLKLRPPYTNWAIEEQAAAAGLVRRALLRFDAAAFPGYKHATTDPEAVPFDPSYCKTYVFARPFDKVPSAAAGESGSARPAVAAPAAGASAGKGRREKKARKRRRPDLRTETPGAREAPSPVQAAAVAVADRPEAASARMPRKARRRKRAATAGHEDG